MTSSFIIMSYPRFAGGKFLSNCLSLSKFCCPQDPVSAEYLLDFPDDYEYRLRSVMKTIPLHRTEMTKWIEKYEFGDTQLYHRAINRWQNGVNCQPNDLVGRLLRSEFKLFLTAHGGDTHVRNLLKIWPNSTIIKLINHVKFSEISQKLKSTDNKTLEDHAGNYCKQKYQLLAGGDWPSWEEFESVGYDVRKLLNYREVADEILSFYNWKNIDNTTFLFDVDRVIFNRTKFLEAMEQLYRQLNFTDFDPELVGKFWQSYMSLHVDNVDIT